MPTSKSSNKHIGITLGDPGGIGPEIIVKALRNNPYPANIHFHIIGDKEVLYRYTTRLPKNVSVIDTNFFKKKQPILGKVSKQNGKASLEYLNKAVQLIQTKTISALITAPVSKESIAKVNPLFIGHTEFLADKAHAHPVGMMFVAHELKTIIVTRHIPIKDVPKAVNTQAVLETIELTHRALKKLFNIRIPKIAVCGLNPHAGEGGKIGREDIVQIVPSIKKACQKKMKVYGPFAADTLFIKENACAYDCIVAMYHDQGLIPIKTIYFHDLVNLTIGLPYIRTSPAHGTAFDIVGKNKANPSSMTAAIKLAVQLS